jgi:hypothetical protein
MESMSVFEFPYQVTSPVTNKIATFNDEKDVWDEINAICETPTTRSVGQELYFLIPLFANPSIMVTDETLDLINEYMYINNFNIPMASSIDECDAERLVLMTIIHNEYAACKKYKVKKDG